MSVSLAEMIDQIREELPSPREARTPEAMYPFLFVEEVEVEVGVQVSSKVDANGKITIQVVEVGSNVGISNQETHLIKVKLTPLFTKEETRKKLEQQLGARG